MLGEIYRWIWRAGLLCLAVGGFVPLATPPKNRPTASIMCLVAVAGNGDLGCAFMERTISPYFPVDIMFCLIFFFSIWLCLIRHLFSLLNFVASLSCMP
jgi:hypothetical protein